MITAPSPIRRKRGRATSRSRVRDSAITGSQSPHKPLYRFGEFVVRLFLNGSRLGINLEAHLTPHQASPPTNSSLLNRLSLLATLLIVVILLALGFIHYKNPVKLDYSFSVTTTTDYKLRGFEQPIKFFNYFHKWWWMAYLAVVNFLSALAIKFTQRSLMGNYAWPTRFWYLSFTGGLPTLLIGLYFYDFRRFCYFWQRIRRFV